MFYYIQPHGKNKIKFKSTHIYIYICKYIYSDTDNINIYYNLL